MAEYNPNIIYAGLKIESTVGVAETLADADYDVDFIDAEEIQYSSDKSAVGKKANGSLINTAKVYSRTVGGTGAVKLEVKVPADPTVEPTEAKVYRVAGLKVQVIDAGTNDNYEIRYDGKPECTTATYETIVGGCATTACAKKLKGSVIADGKFTIEGAGAPMVFSGTVTGAFLSPAGEMAPTIAESTESCIQGTGLVFKVGTTVYNFTKLELMTNLSNKFVTDMSDSNDTNISHGKLSSGGSSTMTFSAIPIDCGTDFDNLVDSATLDSITVENDDVLITIFSPQIGDLQSVNEDGVMVQDYTCDINGFVIQYK